MDTPQVTATLLDQCLESTTSPGATASLGLAEDGGWWALGLSAGWEVDVFAGVAMSRPTTGADQLAALRTLGHVVRPLPVVRDIDLVEDLRAVAASAPLSRVASVWRRISAGPVRP
jgi:glycosyltransferase A (GT-A) superfamily protein (DUF2064 family)